MLVRPVGEGGFEPPTACPQSRCATTAPLPGPAEGSGGGLGVRGCESEPVHLLTTAGPICFEQHRANAEGSSVVRVESSPFVVAGPAPAGEVIGRADVLAAIADRAARGRFVLLTAPRRYGEDDPRAPAPARRRADQGPRRRDRRPPRCADPRRHRRQARQRVDATPGRSAGASGGQGAAVRRRHRRGRRRRHPSSPPARRVRHRDPGRGARHPSRCRRRAPIGASSSCSTSSRPSPPSTAPTP